VLPSTKRVDHALVFHSGEAFSSGTSGGHYRMSEVRRSFLKPAGQTADDEPHGRLGSAGKSCTFRRIVILKSRLNQQTEPP